MDFTEEQVMLTLAALTYRGFQDGLTGTLHEGIVREALLDGLDSFEPVRGQWDLVWGPATTRHVPLKTLSSLAVFDWNAMSVVRHREFRNKYAIAIRGTNPISSRDWLFGDLWVGTAVPWPYSSGKELISTSTALGLTSLQSMRSASPVPANNLTHVIAKEVRDVLHAISRSGERALKGLTGRTTGDLLSHVDQQLTRIVQHWTESVLARDTVWTELHRLGAEVLVQSQELRPKLLPESQREGKLDLLTFLRTQTDQSAEALEVTVTGHSKGGALASAVALWLKESLGSDETWCWDRGKTAKVRCYAFAGPTAGNAAFASYIDKALDKDFHQVVNTNDVVPHGFRVDDLLQIPGLYGKRSEALGPLVALLVAGVRHLNYEHPTKDLRTFKGELDPTRPFAVELVQQHLDAYLADLKLLSDEMNAFKFFV